MQISVDGYMPEGKMALWRDGKVVWVGSINSPIEDAVCDRATLNQRDYDRLFHEVDAFNNHPVNKMVAAAFRAVRDNS